MAGSDEHETHLAAPRLGNEVASLVAELSGYAVEELDQASTFFELGFDSLFLAQLSTAVQQRYGVSVTFRQLFEETHTIDALSRYLLGALSEEELASRFGSVVPDGEADGDAHSTGESDHNALESSDLSNPEVSTQGLLRIVSAQRRLMAQQLRLLEEAGCVVKDPTNTPLHQPADATFPLTDSQREIWQACQISPQVHTAYNESETLILDGDLNTVAFQRAIEATVSRHQSLHLRFANDGSHQWIDEESLGAPVVDLIDLTESEPEEREARLKDKIHRLATETFDLQKGPTYYAGIIKLSKSLHHFVFYAHHLVYDGWSAGVLIGDISAHYAAYLRGEEPALRTVDSYQGFVTASERAKATEEYAADLDFWRRKVEGGGTLELPTDVPRAPVRRGQGGTVKHRFGDEFYRAVNQAARTFDTSKFNVLITLFAILLRRLCGQEHLTVGVSVAGQATLGFSNLIGHCVNLLPLRLQLDDVAFQDLLRRVRGDFLELYDHNRCTLGAITESLDLRGEPGRTPVVEVIFNFSQFNADLDLPGLRGLVIENPKYSSHVDLFAKLREDEDFMTADWDYNAAVFSAETVAHWLRCFEALSLGVLESPEVSVLRLPVLAEVDEDRMLSGWNQTASPIPDGECVHSLIQHVVCERADAAGLSFGPLTLTYQELWDRSSEIAEDLRALGVVPGSIVAVCLERGIDLVPALLAVWRSGCAYLPLDALLPLDRLVFMLTDSGCTTLVTSRMVELDLTAYVENALYVDDVPARTGTEARGDDSHVTDPESLAYVIYTSGSTGTPKGVRVTHRNVVNFLASMRVEPGLDVDDILLAVTTPTFDISVLELFLPLIVGGQVVIAPAAHGNDGVLLAELLETSGATVMQATPSTWRLLIASGWAGKPMLRALSGGEALSPSLAADLLGRVGSAWNMYGPTETTIWSTVWPIVSDAEVSIGRPIANTSIYVLDEQRLPVPIGVVGEIHIGGEGVTPGYLDRADLTDEKFIFLALTNRERVRVYATGDLGYFRTDGSLICLGRIDTQVKVRGHRIELGEIETALANHPDVRESAVVVRESLHGDAEIVGYAATSASLTRADVIGELRRFLPEYMLPQRMVFLEDLPKTHNNKIDRKSLPPPGPERAIADTDLTQQDASRHDSVSIQSRGRANAPLESRLLTLWQEELGRDDIGLDESFVDVGGHSLVAVRLVNRLRDLVDESIYVVSIYDSGTIERLAEYLIEHYPKAVHRAFPELAERRTAPSRSGVAVPDPSSSRPFETLDRPLEDRAVRQFRKLVPSIPVDHAQGRSPNKQAVFLLSAPRSGSTLTRVMMAGLPQLFSPPELFLMNFNTMRERDEYIRDHWNEVELQGLIRALMELRSWDEATAAEYVAQHVEAETPIGEFCAELQKMIGSRLLVDKTPDYAYDQNALFRLESWFEDPLYVHLVRHPAGMMNSFLKLRMDRFSPYRDRFAGEEIAELNWFVANDNIARFLSDIPYERKHLVRLEDLVREPQYESDRLARFLGIPFDPEMLNPYGSGRSRMSDGVNSPSLAIGDPRFHEHSAIDSSVADAWRTEAPGIRTSPRTRDLARSYGYHLEEDALPVPMKFGERGRLFGMYHPPHGDHAGTPVVICPPLLLDHVRTHRCLRQLASDLARSGGAVLRFDYLGTGDSDGNLADASAEGWLSDVATAIEEVKRESGVGSVRLVGIRMGGLLAALAAAEREDVTGVVLWDPVANGEQFLDELSLVHRQLLEEDPRFDLNAAALDDEDELVGFSMPDDLRSEIAPLDIASVGEVVSAPLSAAVVWSDEYPDADSARKYLTWTGSEQAVSTVPYECRWTTFTGTVLFPNEILKVITDRLDGMS